MRNRTGFPSRKNVLQCKIMLTPRRCCAYGGLQLARWTSHRRVGGRQGEQRSREENHGRSRVEDRAAAGEGLPLLPQGVRRVEGADEARRRGLSGGQGDEGRARQLQPRGGLPLLPRQERQHRPRQARRRWPEAQEGQAHRRQEGDQEAGPEDGKEDGQRQEERRQEAGEGEEGGQGAQEEGGQEVASAGPGSSRTARGRYTRGPRTQGAPMAQCRDRRPFDSAPSFFRARFPPFVAVTVADY